MSRHHIKLTADEQALVDRIDLRVNVPHAVDGHAVYLANKEPILALLKLLVARDAIPKHRIAYWTDPKLNSGRLKGSHRDLFARNGSSGAEAYTHPHFKPYLRYFLYGADLPDQVIEEFEKQIGNPEWFSGSDIIALTKRTREIIRSYRVQDSTYADEFHKLALDNGLSASNAESVKKNAAEAIRREFKR
ncbi:MULTISPECIES: hypothetical protein [Mesorhizobium]|uniref:hypothetical protein n=1 Tax=Mesorhizobium TaxID=68287 RepID=UPI0010A95AC8|nr:MULTISPECIES: hypothetical protein [Mesorhizobium]